MVPYLPTVRLVVGLALLVIGAFVALYGCLAYSEWFHLPGGVALLVLGWRLRWMELHRSLDKVRCLRINWWLWLLLSTPPVVYSWLRPEEVKGEMWSEWEYLVSYLQREGYKVTAGIWRYFIETFIWSVVPPVVVGWLAQYFIMLAWEAWRQRRTAHTAVASD